MFSMNRLPVAKRAQILSMLVEGMSMRAISRVADVSFNTVAKLLTDAGEACAAYHDEHVRGVRGHRHIQCDEIWSFVYTKEGNLPPQSQLLSMLAIPGRSRRSTPRASCS